jgi:PAS domain S-box-containing protein
MKDEEKTKEQLIEKLAELRQRLVDLEASEAQRKRAEWALGERVKELTCLYMVSHDMQEDLSTDELCRRVVEYLVPAMQLPEITVPVIELDGRRFTSEKYTEGLSHGLHAEIRVGGEARGHLWVYYAEDRPFLIPEEQNLVNGVAEALSLWLEHKWVEEALAQERNLLRALMDNVPDYVYFKDRESRFIRTTKAHAKMFGLSDPAEAIGKTDFDFFSDKHAHQAYEDEQEIIRTGQPLLNMEERETWPDWPDTWVLTSKMPLRDEEGKIVGTFGISKDITERKRAEEALRESEEKYRLLVENATVTIIVAQDGMLKFFNPKAMEITGYSQKELASRPFTELIHPDDLDVTFGYYLRFLQGEETPPIHAFRIIDKEGSIKWLESNAVLITWEGKLATLNFINDITERKRAEEALRESREKYREMINGMNDTVWVIGFDGKFVDVNETAVKVLGYSREELLSMGPADIDSHLTEEQIKDLIRRMPSDEIQVFETEYTTKEGKTIPVEISSSLVTYRGRQAILSIARDITERRRAEEEIRRHLERVEALREIDRAITSTLDLTEVLDIILGELKRVIPYHSAGIFLLSDGTAKLAAGRGFPDLERALQVAFRVEEDALAHELLQEKRPLVLADAQADERFRARGGTTYVRSWIGVPLIAKGEAIGFLTIDHREPGVYSEESAEIAEGFANQAALAIENARLYEETQQELAERERAEEELQQSFEELRRAFEGTVTVLISAVEMRDPYTAGHQRRVTQLACAIANEMDLPQEQIEGIRLAGLIHDIGKINVPAEILSKPGQLTDLEFGLIKMHPQTGHDVLRAIEFPWPVAQIVLQHHERMDGSGYPQGLSGEEIILEARVLGVADVAEAMASHRPYRAARGIDEALEEISQNRGTLYDPKVVDACLRLFTEKGFKFE